MREMSKISDDIPLSFVSFYGNDGGKASMDVTGQLTEVIYFPQVRINLANIYNRYTSNVSVDKNEKLIGFINFANYGLAILSQSAF